MKFQILCIVRAILLLTSKVSSQTPLYYCYIQAIMRLVGSKPIRSNVKIPTTSFLCLFFSNDVMCHVHYDVINFIIPSLSIGHFTVKDGSETDGDLVLIQTFLLYHVNQVILMLTSIFQGQFP